MMEILLINVLHLGCYKSYISPMVLFFLSITHPQSFLTELKLAICILSNNESHPKLSNKTYEGN